MGFDELDIEILEDDFESSDEVKSEEVQTILSESAPANFSRKVAKGEFFPKIEILINEGSALEAVRMEALKNLLNERVKGVSDGEDIVDSLLDEDVFKKYCIVVSNASQSFVVGTLFRTQLSFFYNLLPNVEMRLSLSESEIYDKSKILALR